MPDLWLLKSERQPTRCKQENTNAYQQLTEGVFGTEEHDRNCTNCEQNHRNQKSHAGGKGIQWSINQQARYLALRQEVVPHASILPVSHPVNPLIRIPEKGYSCT